MRRALTIALLLLGLAAPGWAADLFVDGDNCPGGSGTTGDPYCSIQTACSNVSAGDTIKLRETATNPDYDEQAVCTTDGTAGSPIVIEPDASHSPTLISTTTDDDAVIVLQETDHVIIQNLTFDGSSANTSAYAVKIIGPTAGTTGIQILGNTFLNWGAGASTHGFSASLGSFVGDDAFKHANMVIQGNTFDGGRHHGMLLRSVLNTTVAGNTLQNLRCGIQSGGSAFIEGIKFAQGGTAAEYTSNNSIRDNIIKDTNAVECSTTPAVYPIWGDRGVESVTVERNTIQNTPGGGAGIHVESRCNNWLVTNNLVIAGPHESIRNRNADNTRFYHNTLIGSAWGARLSESANTDWKNNLVQATEFNWNVTQDAINEGGHTFDTNLYDTNGIGTFQWNGSPTETFTQWKSACSCDGSSLLDDPDFTDAPNADYHLTAGSPAINAGTSLAGTVDADFDDTERPQGAGWDIGAFELVEAAPPTAGLRGSLAGARFRNAAPSSAPQRARAPEARNCAEKR